MDTRINPLALASVAKARTATTARATLDSVRHCPVCRQAMKECYVDGSKGEIKSWVCLTHRTHLPELMDEDITTGYLNPPVFPNSPAVASADDLTI